MSQKSARAARRAATAAAGGSPGVPGREAEGVTLRLATASDAAEIDRLGFAVMPEWRGMAPSADHLAGLIRGSATSRWRVGVARAEDGRVAGAVVTKPCSGAAGELRRGRWAELLFVVVAPDLRRAGVGTALVALALATLSEAGFWGVIASTRPPLAPWWERLGWHVPAAPADLEYVDVDTVPEHRSVTWHNPVDSSHPLWIWRPTDPARPVRAFYVRGVAGPPMPELAAEIRTQLGYVTDRARAARIAAALEPDL
ncbi:GNAT family N-acetyltransferase [Actinotalea sp. K2]|uniref:GNAT family N-acetyltransferase n=1 Tax=Actinotalea sp. K2 TaxID=2939438 RepID=UPI002016D54D|nr:GNAT family N-acetyltransferase [Actinotalea sp. K2]MCL3862068.1 GNAT family N-acetyltransferase [Actinotalea sp. K2]